MPSIASAIIAENAQTPRFVPLIRIVGGWRVGLLWQPKDRGITWTFVSSVLLRLLHLLRAAGLIFDLFTKAQNWRCFELAVARTSCNFFESSISLP